MKRVCIIACTCGSALDGKLDRERLVQGLKEDPQVTEVFIYDRLCSQEGLTLISELLRDGSCDRVVIGACSVGPYEAKFRDVVRKCGLDPNFLEVVNIREQCAYVHEDVAEVTQKTLNLLRGASARVVSLCPVVQGSARIIREALVVGGGIAGVQCALDIANAGYQVSLIEREPSIGGVMAQLDKTIPTLDCSICIEGPKLSDAGRNKRITIVPNAEVKEVRGMVGNFVVRVEVRPTYVDPQKCNGCGACVDVCPVYQPNRYDVDLKPIKAIFSPFAQAVPLKYVINKEICTECGLCMKACGLAAINFTDEPKTLEFRVGAIVVATGADPFDPKLVPLYHYGEFDGVITNMEFERIICASGPTGGELLLRNGHHPLRVAFIQCVGSRDVTVGMEDCSSYCCAVSLKQAMLIREHDPNAKIFVLYTDMRTFGKGWEELYSRTRGEGVSFIRSRPSEIRRNSETGCLSIPYEDSLTGRRGELEVDMVVLALGMRPGRATVELANLLRVPTRKPGFIEEAHPKAKPLETIVDGVFVAGTCHGPRDISESVVEGSGAAGLVISLFGRDEMRIPTPIAEVDSTKCTGCQRCFDACEYGAIIQEAGKAKVLEGICKGCGSCVATCVQEAVTLRNWSSDQIIAQLSAMVGY